MTPDEQKEARMLVERLTGHTPGPWRIHDCETHVDRGLSFYQEVWNDDIDILVTTEVTRAHNDGGRSNMRLISSAPDLHRHLTAALDEIEGLREALGKLRSICLNRQPDKISDGVKIADDALKGQTDV